MRRALFEVEDQDRAVDLGGVIALATGDPTLGERLAGLLSSLDSDTGIPADLATEAAAIAESFGFPAGPDEPAAIEHEGLAFEATGTVGQDLDSGGRWAEYECPTKPGSRIRVYDSGTIVEGRDDEGEVGR